MNKKKVYPWWFVAIPLILYILFFLLPSVLGVFYSFTDWSRMTPKNGLHFVGLKNYSEIFSGKSQYANGILNTLKFTIISNIVKIIPALFLAILLQESVRGKNFYRTVFYLPSILPFVVIGLIFTSVFNYSNGLLNNTLDFLHMGFAKQKWLSDLHVVWKSVYMVDAWRGIGYVMTIFIAGLNAIPKEYYEAARIDGANFWQRLRYVTLPMMRGGPGHATEVITTYVYELYGSGKYGVSTALSSLLLAVSAVVGFLIVKQMRTKEEDAA